MNVTSVVNSAVFKHWTLVKEDLAAFCDMVLEHSFAGCVIVIFNRCNGI